MAAPLLAGSAAEGLVTTLAGIGAGVLCGLMLAQAGSFGSVVVATMVVSVGLAPLVMSLGRLALPIWVALFGVLYPFVRFPSGDPVLTFDRLFLAAMLIGAILSFTSRPQAREGVWVQRSFLVLAAVFLLSALAGGQRSDLAIWTDAFVLPFLVFWFAREWARERRGLLALAAAMALAGASIAILGLAQKFAGLDLTPLLGSVDRFDASIGEVRISGPFPVPEPYALVLLSCLAGTLFWMRCRGSAALVPGGIAVALELTAIFFTYFRAAWLGAALILLVAFAGGKRSWAGRIATVVLLAAGMAVAVAVADNDETVRARLHNQENVSGRLATYQRGIDLFERHPISGVGFGRFEIAAREVPRVSVGGVEAIPQAHSSLVSTLAEQGLVGFIPLLACAVSLALALRALRLRARDRIDRDLATYVIGAALAYLVMSATLTMIYYGPSNAMMALLVGLACGRLDVISRPA